MPYYFYAKALLTRFRSRFGRRSRALVCVLMLGALGAVPIPPEEIEKHLQSMGKAEMVQILERKQQAPGDPPDEDEVGLPRTDGTDPL